MNKEKSLQIRPRIQLLSKEEIEKFYHGALKILERTGVRVAHPKALELLRKAGCFIQGDSLVRIHPHLVEEALRTVPKRIVLYDREENPTLDLKGQKTYYT